MKAIELLVNDALPPEMRDGTPLQLDAKGLNGLLARLAREHPEKYEGVAKRLSDIGRKASWLQGETLTVADTRPVFDREKIFAEMDAKIREAKKASKGDDDFKSRRERIWMEYSDSIEKATTSEAMKRGNNLAYSVASGARGKPAQLKMMISTPGVYADSKGRTIPLFVRHSFGDGLRPAEYLASTYGARASVISTKVATARGGDLSKQMVQASAPIVVTERDCGVRNGIDLDPDDKSLRGRVLGRDTAGMPAGTVLDRHAMAQIRKAGVKKVVARSPMTCQAKEGVCSKCMGLDAVGKLPPIGESVGMTGAQAIGEPITQMGLDAKHQGGVAGAKKEYSGFNVINQFAQSPEIYPDRAAVARTGGVITGVKEAPQGGFYVTVANGEPQYVPPGYPVTVKRGDEVEPGDQLSEGLVDAGEIVELRGLGSGRRYYRDRMLKILEDTGMSTDARNVEVLARAAIDHIRVDDAGVDDDFLPDDIVSYNHLQPRYVPARDTQPVKTKEAAGRYLQEPALHYTVGTKLTPKMVSRLGDAGFEHVAASETTPTFHPEMVRLRASSHYNPDWMAAMHTSYLKKQLGDAAARGRDADTETNVHFAPRLARGVGFGDNIGTTGKF